MHPSRQFGFLWGGVAAALVVLSPLARKLAGGLPACPLKTVSGVPCPGCGSTRAALALSELDLPAALAMNPLATAAWVVLVGGGLLAGALALSGRSVPDRIPPLSVKARLAAVAVLALNWLYLLRAGI